MSSENLRHLDREENGRLLRFGGRSWALDRPRSISVPDRADAQWSLDFSYDAFANGRRFRVLAVVDDFTRECLALVADTSLSDLRVGQELEAIICWRGQPGIIVTDNGNELTMMAVSLWCQQSGVELYFIPPRLSEQNTFVERLIGRFRDECVRQRRFSTLIELRSAINEWKKDYHAHLPDLALETCRREQSQ